MRKHANACENKPREKTSTHQRVSAVKAKTLIFFNCLPETEKPNKAKKEKDGGQPCLAADS